MTPQARMFLAMLHETADGHGIIDERNEAQGPWVFVNEHDQVQAEGLLVDGVPHGTWRVWDAKGQLRSMSEWDHGQPCGRWVTWDGDGNIERVDVKGKAKPTVVQGTWAAHGKFTSPAA
jgi:hypothetical protein